MNRIATFFFLSIALGNSLLASEDSVIAVFKEYCVRCHGEGPAIEGEVNLLEINSIAKLTENAAQLQKIFEVVDLSEMPPPDQTPLDTDVRAKLLTELKTLRHQALNQEVTFAPIPIRRLNRFQYNNAVADLLDLKCNVFTLPERMLREHKNYFRPESGKMGDVVSVGSRPLGKSQMIEPRLEGVAAFPQDLRASHGFDNQADHLSMSPLLMEAFLTLGQSITQSPDFTPQNVGIWADFFQPPQAESDQLDAVRSRLEWFLTRAFRRPVEPDLVDRYVASVRRQLESGVAFEAAMKSIAAAAMASPRFLYLFDKASAQTDGQSSAVVDDYELATRLSFFLWGGLPDDQLIELAQAGELHKQEVLAAQFERMIRDQRLKRFCDSFPAQWLQLDRIISSIPNPDKFPDFYFLKYRISMHMMLEPLLLFETVLIENLPITQLIDSDFTYRSALLENAYGELGGQLRAINQPAAKKGVNAVTVLEFHRLPVVDRRIGGVITSAAVMTMTSGPDRTQPITRGAWIAGVIFNDPPKPPPANVPALDEKPTADEVQLTLRERLANHRERSDCRACHQQIDPLGFALENFDPVGRWRDTYENGRKVDMEGQLFHRHSFSNVVEFKQAILAEKDRFARGLAGHLLAYAIARELGPADQLALDRIVEATVNDGYKFQTLIKQVVLSEPFLSKHNPTTADNSMTVSP